MIYKGRFFHGNVPVPEGQIPQILYLMLKSTYNPVNYNIFPIFCRNLHSHWSRWIRFVSAVYAWRDASWSRPQGEGSEVGHHRVAGHDIQRYSPDLVLMDRMDSNI